MGVFKKSITITRQNLSNVQDLAVQKGVDVEFLAVSADFVLTSLWGMEFFGNTPERVKAAERCAEKLVHVVFNCKREGDLLAVADRTEGALTFSSVPGSDFEWSTEAMDNFDFTRCDRCGSLRQRVKSYLIRKGDTVEQLGGTCAASAAERLRNYLSFINLVSKGGNDSEFKALTRPTVPPPILLAMCELSVRVSGFVPASESRSTKQDVQSLSFVYLTPRHPSKNALMEQLSEIDIDALYEEALAWAEGLYDNSFSRNVKAALVSGADRLIGTMAYVPQGLRKAREKAASKALEESLLGESFLYNPDQDSLDSKMSTWAPADLGVSDRSWSKLGTGKASKTLLKKLNTCVSGVWTVASVRAHDSELWGTTTYIKYVRTDGATLEWKASGIKNFKPGEKYRLRGHVESEVRKDSKYGDKRWIKRVTCIPA